MKKFLTTFGLVVGILLAGCKTVSNLTPAQIQQVGTVITLTADQGALYAIQKDRNNATYFKLADATIDTFVLGSNPSPAALQAALSSIPGATNQWVSLAVSAAVVAYDVSYSQYVSGAVSSNAVAVAWVSAVETGFKQALAQTGTGLRASKSSTPYFLKNGAVDKAVIAKRVKARK